MSWLWFYQDGVSGFSPSEIISFEPFTINAAAPPAASFSLENPHLRFGLFQIRAAGLQLNNISLLTTLTPRHSLHANTLQGACCGRAEWTELQIREREETVEVTGRLQEVLLNYLEKNLFKLFLHLKLRKNKLHGHRKWIKKILFKHQQNSIGRNQLKVQSHWPSCFNVFIELYEDPASWCTLTNTEGTI